MAAVVDREKCTGCGDCVESCPLEAIALVENVAVINEDDCSDCGSCVDVCPSEAISL